VPIIPYASCYSEWSPFVPRPVKWSRDLHPLRERASRSQTETWGRKDIERLFDVGRATAQTLMKAIGAVQTVGAAHFVERSSLLAFLDRMILAPSIEEAFRQRVREAEAPPAPKSLKVSLPHDLRIVTLRDLPENIRVSSGRLEITAGSAVAMLESLALLAQAMQNDLEQVRSALEPPVSPPQVEDQELQSFLAGIRSRK
jgi:hypothetical protein